MIISASSSIRLPVRAHARTSRRAWLIVPALALALSAGCSDDDGGDKPTPDAGGAKNDASTPLDAGGGGGRDAAMDAARADAQVSPSDAASPRDGGTVVTPSDASTDSGSIVTLPPTVSVVYIGGYDGPVRTYALDRSTGNLTEKGTPLDVGDNPAYITPDATGKRLYVANESFSGSPALSVLSLDAMGLPSKLDRKVTDDAAVYSSLTPSGKFLLMASYNGGFAAVYAIESDGKLGALVDKKSFAKPSGADSAQTHSVRVTPDGRFAYVPNKALNNVAQYAVDPSTGKLSELTPPVVANAGGPRHITIDNRGAFAYVVTEISGQVVAYSIATGGQLAEIDREDALAPDVTLADKKGAHVLLTPNGKFVYASIRGNSTIASYTVGDDGKLSLLERVSSGGSTPRNFDIDSSGKFLIVANQASGNDGNVVVFAIGNDGKLTKTGTPVTGLKSPCAVSIVSH